MPAPSWGRRLGPGSLEDDRLHDRGLGLDRLEVLCLLRLGGHHEDTLAGSEEVGDRPCPEVNSRNGLGSSGRRGFRHLPQFYEEEEHDGIGDEGEPREGGVDYPRGAVVLVVEVVPAVVRQPTDCPPETTGRDDLRDDLKDILGRGEREELTLPTR